MALTKIGYFLENSICDLVAIFDLEWNYVYFNTPLADHVERHYLQRPIIGKDPYYLFSTEVAKILVGQLKKCLDEGPYKEITMFPGENRNVHYEITYSPIKEQDKITGVALLAREVPHVGNKIPEIVSMINHELKNPLTAIIGLLQLLDTEGLSEKNREFIKVIGTASEKLLTLINDINSISSYDKPDFVIKDEVIDLGRVALKCVKEHQIVKDSRRISVSLIDSKRRKVRGDSVRVTQVISNLISNAVKYNIDDGTVVVKIYRKGEMIRLSVIDSGIGISRENRKRLFTPFSRLHKVKVEGSGLGLYISQILIEKMGGKIGCKSRGEGKGSIFWFELKKA
jgi:signal transduction histidine kinase